MAHVFTKLVCVIGLLTNEISSFSTDWSTEFDYYTYLDEDELFRLYWNNLDNDMIEFGMEASATGWIALGVSPNGGMIGSDIMIGWVDDDGEVYLQDRYTVSETVPILDPHQNLTLISGEESDGMTRIRFKRPKYTCNENDIQLSQGTTRMIWAFHSTEDPTTQCFEDENTITRHTNRGSQSLNLNSGIQLPVELEDDIEYIDVTMDTVAVPGYKDTTYWCKVFEMPDWLDDVRHIVKFAPIIQEGNEGAVHHLLVYQCEDWIFVNDTDPFDQIGAEGECDYAFDNMPVEECRNSLLLYAWAIGGEPLYMPEGIGLPIGGEKGPNYLMMEIHYDNPNFESNIVDSSGFRMYVTQQLRDIEAGIMQVGAWTNEQGHYIPPGLSYAHNMAWMPGECTMNELNESTNGTGINIFANVLHQHTIGVASTLRRIRDGVEIEPVDSNWAYDFNYQNSIIFDPPTKLLPGDTLILDCYYDSTGRDFVTYGGESTSEEMCFSFFFYYPAVDNFWGSAGGKRTDAIASWMYAAKAAGYLTGDLNAAFYTYTQTYDARGAFADIGYNASDSEGALEFYNRLWSPDYPEYDLNYVSCGNDYWRSNASQPSGFEINNPDIFTCDKTITANDHEIICPFTTEMPIDSGVIVNTFIPLVMACIGSMFL